MKKLLLLVIAGTFMFSSCSKKDDASSSASTTGSVASNGKSDPNEAGFTDIQTSDEQEALVVNITGTWCHSCGSWGVPGFEKTLSIDPNKVNGISLHISDEFVTSTSTGLYSFFPSTGTPTFYEGNKAYVAGYRIPDSDINTKISGKSKAGVSVIYEIANGKMTIKSKVKFYGNVAGNHYLALYLIESGLVASQTVDGKNGNEQVPNFIHNNVIRANGAGSSAAFYGVAINNSGTSITSGDEFHKTTTVDIKPEWNTKNIKVLAIITTTDGKKLYSVVNSNTSY